MSEQLQIPAWSGIPKDSSEYITLIAHYYRAEMARMSGWRDRIDRTTNWAITVAGAMLSVSLATPTAHHGVLLFAMVLVLLIRCERVPGEEDVRAVLPNGAHATLAQFV